MRRGVFDEERRGSNEGDPRSKTTVEPNWLWYLGKFLTIYGLTIGRVMTSTSSSANAGMVSEINIMHRVPLPC